MALNIRSLRRIFPLVARSRLYLKQNETQYLRAFSQVPLPLELKHANTMRMFSSESHAEPKKFQFQAETRQLLDIVTHSLYTDKEVFIRELISNASDALEKVNHYRLQNANIVNPEAPLQIKITTDEANQCLIIEDTGIGMSESELIENLGTIARSGSKNFVQELKKENRTDLSSIIGQFGVGFYSVFMVSHNVKVYSRSALKDEQLVWSSDGSGSYEIAPTDSLERGCKIVIHLKEDAYEFCKPERIKNIIHKYSNFVNYPILLNDEKVNVIKALWCESPSSVSDEDYNKFYKFIANAYDKPIYRLHFRTDAPLDLKALFFIPSFHNERFGFGRVEPGIGLYSRKVVIESKCTDILPEWMRFVKGVVDSEDLPLSISREKPQDTMLIQKVKNILTKRVIRFLIDESKNDPEKYRSFFKDFGNFIKEGVCQDSTNKSEITKLLLFESSKSSPGELISFDDYISRSTPEQKNIYYLHAKTRDLAEASPYYEAFKSHNQEVLFIYNPIDEFVMTSVSEFNGRKIVSAESADVDFEKKDDVTQEKLDDLQVEELCEWFTINFPEQIREVTTTTRLVDSPAVITGHESAAFRKMMQYVQQNTGEKGHLAAQNLQINPSHPIIIRLYKSIHTQPEISKIVGRQLFDNALIAAGLMDDSRVMIPRLNSLLSKILDTAVSKTGSSVTIEPTQTKPSKSSIEMFHEHEHQEMMTIDSELKAMADVSEPQHQETEVTKSDETIETKSEEADKTQTTTKKRGRKSQNDKQ